MVAKDNRRHEKMMPIIIDLGLAEYVTSQKFLYLRCGTPGYVAPEVLSIKSNDPVQTYSCVCDIFSLGVIFHILYDLFYAACSKNHFLRVVIPKKSLRKTANAKSIFRQPA